MTLLPAQLRSEERVPVFDPEDGNLALVSVFNLDRPMTPR